MCDGTIAGICEFPCCRDSAFAVVKNFDNSRRYIPFDKTRSGGIIRIVKRVESEGISFSTSKSQVRRWIDECRFRRWIDSDGLNMCDGTIAGICEFPCCRDSAFAVVYNFDNSRRYIPFDKTRSGGIIRIVKRVESERISFSTRKSQVRRWIDECGFRRWIDSDGLNMCDGTIAGICEFPCCRDSAFAVVDNSDNSRRYIPFDKTRTGGII
jgi:hypothetical protein